MSSGETTTDHDTIREWVEARGGVPATVTATEEGEHAGILRIMFPKAKQAHDDNLEQIEWEEFFEKFDDSELAFLYQDKTADGKESRFFKFVHGGEHRKAKATKRKSA